MKEQTNTLHKICEVNGQKIALIGGTYSELQNTCSSLNGILLTLTQTLALKCVDKHNDYVLTTLTAGDVTCGNYKDVYTDIEDGGYKINYDAFINDIHPEL